MSVTLTVAFFFFFFFFNDTATTEIYTRKTSAASDVYKRQRFDGADTVCRFSHRFQSQQYLVSLFFLHHNEQTKAVVERKHHIIIRNLSRSFEILEYGVG